MILGNVSIVFAYLKLVLTVRSVALLLFYAAVFLENNFDTCSQDALFRYGDVFGRVFETKEGRLIYDIYMVRIRLLGAYRQRYASC